MINRRLLLLAMFFTRQAIEARIVIIDTEFAAPTFYQEESHGNLKWIEVEFSCKVPVNDHLPSLNCSSVCSNYFKEMGGWIKQNLYYHDLEVWKNLNKTVEIVADQGIIVECDFSPVPRPQQNNERIKRSPSSQLRPLACDVNYQYIKEFDSCLRISSEIANWDEAKSTCISEGGNLVVIDSEVKQNAIRKMMGDLVEVYWIGLNDIEIEGNFAWADDTPFCYSSWDKGEPNGEIQEENCVHIWKFHDNKDRNFNWNDAQCHQRFRYLCQKRRPNGLTRKRQGVGSTSAYCPDGWEKSRASDTCYHVGSDISNYDDAESYCYFLTSSVASIANFHEQQFVNEYLKKKNTGDVWIGYSDRREENSFEWTDKSQKCYTRWNRNQPDNKGDQDCVKLVRESDYKWDDEKCSLQAQPLCMQKAIKRAGVFTTSRPKVEAPKEPVAPHDITRPVDEWTREYCGSRRSTEDKFDYYEANSSAKIYEDKGFTVTPIEVHHDRLLSYRVNNGTHIFQKSGISQDKIGGGQDARREVRVYAAALGKYIKPGSKDMDWKCGGVVINRKWVLSAAHCFNVRNAIDVVRLGAYNLNNAKEPREDFKIKRFIMYPEYNYPSAYHDLSLIELDREIRFYKPIIRPICLPWDSEVNVGLVGKNITITGWGAKYVGGPFSPVAQEVTITVFDSSRCRTSYMKTNDYDERFPNGLTEATTLCAGAPKGVKDSCQGDSGGPAVYLAENDRYFLAGIVSVGYGCGLRDYPGIYVPIHRAEYLSWIKREAFS